MTDLNGSYRWLQRRKFPFPLALELLLDQVRQAAQNTRRSSLGAYVDETIQVGDRFGDRLERGVARLECAVAYSMVDSTPEAQALLMEVIGLLQPTWEASRDHKHYYAVANWLVGDLLGGLPSSRADVIIAWQTSLNVFEGLVFHPANITGEESWYRERYQEMRTRIDKYLSREQPPAPAETQPPIPLPEGWPVAQLITGGHQILQVIGEIPAGAFSPISGDAHADEKIDLEPEMDTFILSGSDHSMYNLRGPDQVIRLNSAQEYFLLQVTGDSMNRANIAEGDYVLIRRQEIAKDRDIIAVSIQADDQVATLKRYREQNGMIILQPESSNGAWKPREFTRQDLNAGGKAWKFRIHGVALAVFKPSRKANS